MTSAPDGFGATSSSLAPGSSLVDLPIHHNPIDLALAALGAAPSPEQLEVASSTSLISELAPAVRGRWLRGGERVDFPASQVIIRQGEALEYL